MIEGNVHIERGGLLYQQDRYAEAEKEFRAALLAEPENASAHALMALCLVGQDRLKEATKAAQEAIRCAPDAELSHRVLGIVLYHRHHLDEALESAKRAAEIDPYEPAVFSLMASIQIEREDWNGALKAAEEGLALDADHVQCQNWRAMALVKLGRRQEAGQSIAAALAKEPEDALTHANQGWALLHEGKPEKAQEHFREALRLDPTMEWARIGIVEALKAQNWVYRVLLKYFLWMSTLSPRARWGVIIGGYLTFRGLRGIARQAPEWSVWIWPVLGLYVLFALMTWLGDPLFNLLLRANRFGRLALSREQILASNWVGALLLGAVGFGVAEYYDVRPGVLGTLVCVLMIIPISSTLSAPKGWPRKVMVMFSIGLGLAGAAMLACAVMEGRGYLAKGSWTALIWVFLVGAILSPWVSNAMLMSKPRR